MTSVTVADYPLDSARTTAAYERSAFQFTALLLTSALVLQRFGLVLGGPSYLSVVGPVGLLLAGYGVMQGTLVLNRSRLLILMALFAWVMLGSAIRAVTPNHYGTVPSWPSLAQFVALSAFGALTFSRPVDEAGFFKVVNAIFLTLAIAGILQFILQFAGLGLFSFKELVPENLLIEGAYVTVISIGDSGFFKSNGFFLVEPSVFSQFMALAIIIEMLVFRRTMYLAAFAIGLVCSISGTGWLMILGFVATATFSLGLRGLSLSLAMVAIGSLALGGLALLFPSGFDLFMARSGEIYAIGSSGHQRFVTPWWLADFVLSRTPWVALYGLGAGASEHLGMQPAWDYNLNPPVKITLEYGLPAFILYLSFLLAGGARSRTQKALLVPVLILLLLDGGYQQFAPVLFPAMLLIMVANFDLQGSKSSYPNRRSRIIRPGATIEGIS